MAEQGTWGSIQKHGLLSTTALLDLLGINGSQRDAIESCHRSESVILNHRLGRFIVRDQKPLRPSTLSSCLQGVTPRDWYRLLNRMTFFWLTPERLETLLNARAYRNRPHCVLTVDTRQLLERHENRITLCPINSGSTIYNPPTRGKKSFYTIINYPFEHRRKARGKSNAVAELAVDYSVPDIAEFVTAVEHRQGSRVVQRIYP